MSHKPLKTQTFWSESCASKPPPLSFALPLLVIVLLLLSGCAETLKNEKPQLVPGPTAQKLPAVISQIDSSPSNSTLNEASAWSSVGSEWLTDSAQLLSGATPKSQP